MDTAVNHIHPAVPGVSQGVAVQLMQDRRLPRDARLQAAGACFKDAAMAARSSG